MRTILLSVVAIVLFICNVKSAKIQNAPAPRVAVIGAGISGISSARYLKDVKCSFTVFELTSNPGGTWKYDPRIGADEYGDPIQSSMYKNLRTNLPKPLMELPGFPLPEDTDSYPNDEDIYAYLLRFVEHFGLDQYIKYQHKVIRVERKESVWLVTYLNRKTKEESSEEFDYVIVGTGHSNKPNYPSITGEEKFKGRIIHSHDYRVPELYSNRRVLVVGMGPSAVDITMDILPLVSQLYLSHRGPHMLKTKFPDNLHKKPGIKEFNETGVVFVDGTYAEIDDVIYGTGYKFFYPFITESCGLKFPGQYVEPLYRDIVNINQPTMLFVGTIVRAAIVIAIDAQARFSASLISGNFTLPPKGVMMADLQAKFDDLRKSNKPLSQIHWLEFNENIYYANLTELSGITPPPPVFYKIRLRVIRHLLENLKTFRSNRVTILDDYTCTWEYFNEKNNVLQLTAL